MIYAFLKILRDPMTMMAKIISGGLKDAEVEHLGLSRPSLLLKYDSKPVAIDRKCTLSSSAGCMVLRYCEFDVNSGDEKSQTDTKGNPALW